MFFRKPEKNDSLRFFKRMPISLKSTVEIRKEGLAGLGQTGLGGPGRTGLGWAVGSDFVWPGRLA